MAACEGYISLCMFLLIPWPMQWLPDGYRADSLLPPHWTLSQWFRVLAKSHRLFPVKHPDFHMQIQAGGNVIWSCIVVFWLPSAAKQPQGEKAKGSTIAFFFFPPSPFLHGSEICGVCTEQKCIAQALQLWAISFHCTHELSWSLSIMFQSLVLKVAQMELPCEDLQSCSLSGFALGFELPRLWAFPWCGRVHTTGAGKCCHSPGSKLFISVLCRDSVGRVLVSVRALGYAFRLR